MSPRKRKTENQLSRREALGALGATGLAFVAGCRPLALSQTSANRGAPAGTPLATGSIINQTLPVPALGPPPSARTVLRPTDFAYLGMFQISGVNCGVGSDSGGAAGLAIRRIGGAPILYTTMLHTGFMIEFPVPALGVSAPVAETVNTLWNDIKQANGVSTLWNDVSGFEEGANSALCWDEIGQRMYWNVHDPHRGEHAARRPRSVRWYRTSRSGESIVGERSAP